MQSSITILLGKKYVSFVKGRIAHNSCVSSIDSITCAANAALGNQCEDEDKNFQGAGNSVQSITGAMGKVQQETTAVYYYCAKNVSMNQILVPGLYSIVVVLFEHEKPKDTNLKQQC